MKDDEIRDMALDIFREIGNIGTGSAATALSNIVGRPVKERLPQVMRPEIDRLLGFFDRDDEEVMGVLFPFYGDIEGILLIIYREPFVLQLLQRLSTSGACFKEMDDLKLALVKEIANIMASSYFSAISAYRKKKVYISKPAITMDMAGSLISDQAVLISGRGENAVCVESAFSFEGEKDQSYIGMMLYQESTCRFLKELGVPL